MSECTQPPSYEAYVPLEEEHVIIEQEVPQPRTPFVYALTSSPGEAITTSNRTRPQDVVMTWNDGHEIVGRSAVVEAQLAHQPHQQAQAPSPQHRNEEPSTSLVNPQFSPVRPLSLPPDYARARRPKKKLRYSFSPIGPNAMVLLPPPRAQDSRPQYYITVSMNCFMPLSHITTVYRGATEHAPRVGEFESGIISVSNSRVQMGNGPSVSLFNVVTKHGSRENARWSWKPHNEHLSHLSWDTSTVPFDCKVKFTGSEVHTLVAQFTSNMQPPVGQHAGPNPTPALSQLEVFPAGQTCLDDILMSLLVVERKRLTPKTKTDAQLRTLFNY